MFHFGENQLKGRLHQFEYSLRYSTSSYIRSRTRSLCYSCYRLNFPGDFQCDFVFLVNHLGESINITDSVVNLNIYENIN